MAQGAMSIIDTSIEQNPDADARQVPCCQPDGEQERAARKDVSSKIARDCGEPAGRGYQWRMPNEEPEEYRIGRPEGSE
ncbi:hypothetical protein GCM10028812_33800 [Ancylobacter sonchi]